MWNKAQVLYNEKPKMLDIIPIISKTVISTGWAKKRIFKSL